MALRNDTDRVRRQYDRTAARYDDLISFAERMLFGGGREWVCSRARGEVLEIAAGTGRNLPFYAEDVDLTAIELSPEMLEIARRRAATLGHEADLRVGDAQDLPFPDARFDAVVCTLGLCTIPSPEMAVREAARVLRPGGRLLLLEHVRSPLLPVRVLQIILNPITVLTESDHLLREPLVHVGEAGLVVEELERSKLGIVEKLAARRP
ncbi:methyltransferase domain-containing protein [Rubrobacter marinus]|uniref:Methyltransferase domain-containing protein n=1 Tax=Rubrobacter marinus TaxID=2653852 RepID=A0A6G8Q311_9ACTN|nr:class I SAM-dependent methyltransferase [Rubrobacter marinus]QIN80856.1 methyltransferase domain-containing protein [Rubrobacter marinus]